MGNIAPKTEAVAVETNILCNICLLDCNSRDTFKLMKCQCIFCKEVSTIVCKCFSNNLNSDKIAINLFKHKTINKHIQNWICTGIHLIKFWIRDYHVGLKKALSHTTLYNIEIGSKNFSSPTTLRLKCCLLQNATKEFESNILGNCEHIILLQA